MNNYGLRISIPDGKVKEILDRLTEAQEVIFDCYTELQQLGIVTITETEKADSGN